MQLFAVTVTPSTTIDTEVHCNVAPRQSPTVWHGQKHVLLDPQNPVRQSLPFVQAVPATPIPTPGAMAHHHSTVLAVGLVMHG